VNFLQGSLGVDGSYIDEPLLMVAAGVKTYYHANNLYSVAALTNQAGAVVERYTYDPYGKVKILAADGVTVLAASSVGNPWTFTGRRLDGETGLMYFRTRYYDVNLGRFVNRMPWHAFGGRNGPAEFFPLLALMFDNEWHGFMSDVLASAEGAYIQSRYNLYDYAFTAPTNAIEPFSSATAPALRPAPTPRFPNANPRKPPGPLQKPPIYRPHYPFPTFNPPLHPVAPPQPGWVDGYYEDLAPPQPEKEPYTGQHPAPAPEPEPEPAPPPPRIRRVWPSCEDNKKANCDDETYKNFIKCDKLSDAGYEHTTKKELFDQFQSYWGRGVKWHNDSPAKVGPCGGDSGYEQGRHHNIRQGSDRLGSVGECQCCKMTKDGPVLQRWYRFIP